MVTTPKIVLNNNLKTENESDAASKGRKTICSYCGIGPIHLAGPIYTDSLHDAEFVGRLLTRFFLIYFVLCKLNLDLNKHLKKNVLEHMIVWLVCLQWYLR